VRIAQDLLDRIVEHARAEAPNECCGIVVMRDGRAESVQPAKNIHASPLKFEIDHSDQIRLYREFGDFDCIYHSHTRSEPYPSQTDVNFSANWPGVEWLIVGLAGDEPTVRSFLISDGVVREVGVEVE
jgi:proteasome lid subunit RPN8/RPN11